MSLVDWLRQWAKTEEEREEVFIRGFLGKMLFSGEEALKMCDVLSGGEKVRCMLSRMMMIRANVLKLDEPTNHLDLEMIEWLEDYFKKEKITLFMVTHDRYFLERVCNEIIELDHGELYKYKGNYSYYLEKKEERISLEATITNKAKNLFKKELDWMRKQPKARTTKSKSRIDDFFKMHLIYPILFELYLHQYIPVFKRSKTI